VKQRATTFQKDAAYRGISKEQFSDPTVLNFPKCVNAHFRA
jgi:hypothetical protein